MPPSEEFFKTTDSVKTAITTANILFSVFILGWFGAFMFTAMMGDGGVNIFIILLNCVMWTYVPSVIISIIASRVALKQSSYKLAYYWSILPGFVILLAGILFMPALLLIFLS